MAVEEKMEKGEVRSLRGEHRPHSESQHLAPESRAEVAPYPCLYGLGVPRAGALGRPGLLEWDVSGHAIEPELGLTDVGEHVRTELRNGSLVTPERFAVVHEIVAGVVGRIALETELVCEGDDPCLRRPDPLTTELYDGAVGGLCVHHAAARSVTSFEHHNRQPDGFHLACCDKPCEARPYDDDVDVGGRARRQESTFRLKLRRPIAKKSEVNPISTG